MKLAKILLILVILISNYSYTQCSNCASNYPSATQSTTSNSLVNVTTCAYGGDYANYNVTSGETYTWTTCGDTDFDTQLTLTSSGCGGTNLAYNDDDCGVQSTITWTATFTGVVTLLVSEYSCSTNSTCMTVQWACTSCGGGGGSAPPNDDPCNATPLTVNASCVNTTGTNVDATGSSGVPAPGCANYNGGDVWYSVVVPASGSVDVEMSDAGGFTDGGMAAYSGTCGSLSLITCDDDGGSGLFSQISLTGQTPGSTIWFRVWEYGNNNFGDFSICATEPVPPTSCGDSGSTAGTNDFCSTPATLTQQAGTFSSTTSATYSADLPGNVNALFCGSIENNSWYQFTASSATETFDFTSITNCSTGWGVQAEVFEVTYDVIGCCTGFTSMSNCFNPGTASTGTVTATGLTPGQDYMLMIDGWGGDACDFSVSGWTGINILPVNIISLLGYTKENKNLLTWTTASEENNDYFIIEKSFDGKKYEKVGIVNGNGNSSSKIDYEFKDSDINHKTTYYKLFQVDFNGDKKYLGVIVLTREFNDIAIYPNPAKDQLNFKFDKIDKQQYSIEYIDVTGRVVEETLMLNNSNVVKSKIFESLNKGYYIVRITDQNGNVVKTSKLIKN